MNRIELFNDSWSFSKVSLDISYEQKDLWQKTLEPVAIPHDFLISDTLNLYGDATGFYHKKYLCHKEDDQEIYLNFDGVYMDWTLYINDKEIGQWKYGYSPATFCITDALVAGENDIVVKVVHKSPNSRWYSGAGIYRNITLLTNLKEHILPDGVYTYTREKEGGYELFIDTEISKRAYDKKCKLSYTLWNRGQVLVQKTVPVDEAVVLNEEKTPDGRLLNNGYVVSGSLEVSSPTRWHVDEPYLYDLSVELLSGSGEVLHKESRRIGFCTKEFSSEEGFLLNGKKLRINGVCEHHDLGALGAAFSREAMKRKLILLKEMGVNGLRTSHNMPAREVMDLADEMGFLVVAEAFDMWEKPKTEYDYSRFFKEWSDIDLRSFVRRDRSHVSLLMWSIGNEIYDTHADSHGEEITKRLKRTVEKYDYAKNGRVTIGSNYMAWNGAQNCAEITGFAGYNYGERLYDEQHKAHPNWIIYGSETASVVKSRGIYHFPLERTILSDEDEQCSSLGNSHTGWGAKNEEYCITRDRDAFYSCGQFLWTGFDYIGEPTPYQTKNSYFGQIDTAGIPKDAFYIYKGEWTDYKKSPFVHIFPHWDFNPGQLVDVRVCSNAPRIQLYINDVLMKDQMVDHEKGEELLVQVKTHFVPGKITGVALDEQGRELAREERKTPGEAARLCITPWKKLMKADGEDLNFFEISVVDEEGNPVDNDAHYVEVLVSGSGDLVGLDNGDSTDYDSYEGTIRKLFSGKLTAIVAAGKDAGEIKVEVRDARESAYYGKAPRLQGAEVSLKTEKCRIMKGAACTVECVPASVREGICLRKKSQFVPLTFVPVGFVPARKLEISCDGGFRMCPGRETIEVEARIYPEDATDQPILFKAVNESGIETNLATIESYGNKAIVTAKGDGNFFIRAMVKNGTDKVKLISQMKCSVEGLGVASLNPYEFVVGGLFNESKGAILNGIQNGASTAWGESVVGFSGLDFGSFGSDTITVSIFANSNDPQFIQFYEGMPGEEGSSLLYEGVYHKQSKWQVFQEETYVLNKKLRGITTLSMLTRSSLELGGFVFKKYNPAFETNYVVQNQNIYGDSFTVLSDCIEHIGNNVSISYENMDFGVEGISRIMICGRTPLEKNTIHVRFHNEEESINEIVEFSMEAEYTEKTFELKKVCGKYEVSFIFLPGCDFDFKYFRFS